MDVPKSWFCFSAPALRFATPLALFLIPLAFSTQALAGVFELSAGFAFNRNNYSDTDYEWTRRYTVSFGYHLTDMSEIEFSFEDSFDRTKIDGFEDTSFHDQVTSLNWVQALTGKQFPVQPYFKVGIGQLDRDASGSYAMGAAPPAVLDQVTAILGAGLRIYFSHVFGLRIEGTTYLVGGAIDTWQQNYATQASLSLYF